MGTSFGALVYTISMRAHGFTLIELIVSTALVVVLLSVALPRYNAYSTAQDFKASSGIIVQCLQKAQLAAMYPKEVANASFAYTMADITYDASGVMNCHTYSYASGSVFNTDGSLQVASSPANAQIDMNDPVTAPSTALCLIKTTTDTAITSLQTPSEVRVKFSVLQHGVPQAVYSKNITGVASPVAAAAFAAGIAIDLNTAAFAGDTTTSCAGVNSIVSVAKFGVPIQLY